MNAIVRKPLDDENQQASSKKILATNFYFIDLRLSRKEDNHEMLIGK